MRCTVEEGMNKMLESEILIPEATQISMVPMPTTWAELPPNPLTLMGGMGQSNLKLEDMAVCTGVKNKGGCGKVGHGCTTGSESDGFSRGLGKVSWRGMHPPIDGDVR